MREVDKKEKIRKICEEYSRFSCGYKRLARKYGVSRDFVRYHVRKPLKRPQFEAKGMGKKRKKPANRDGWGIEDWKAAADVWEDYAKRLEKAIGDEEKLRKLREKLKKESVGAQKGVHAVKRLCAAIGISRSGFYRKSVRKGDGAVLEMLAALPKVVRDSRGSKAKCREVRERFGAVVNHKRMARICRENGLLAKVRRMKLPKGCYEARKEWRENLPENALARNFAVGGEAMRRICTDVTQARTRDGWLYLSAAQDLRSGEIVAFNFSRRNDEALAMRTLDILFKKGMGSGATLHSDQGCLYTSPKFRGALAEKGVAQSMSRRGNCWDNARIESFWGTMKTESGFSARKSLLPASKVRRMFADYIGYYNSERLQKNLGWKAPKDF